MCRWKDSSEVEPRAHWYTFSSTPPWWLCQPPYRAEPLVGQGYSWRALLPFSHSSQILLLLKRGTPSVSRPCSPSKNSVRLVMLRTMSSVLWVVRRQWSANSRLVILLRSSLSPGSFMPWLSISLFFAYLGRSRLLLSHWKMHCDSLAMNVWCSWWDSVEQPVAIRHMKW